jgi:hypothetical protein
MASKRVQRNPVEQSAQFRRAAEDMVNAGELDLTGVDAALDALVRRAKKTAEDTDADEPRRQD